jgi:hypothetical protein
MPVKITFAILFFSLFCRGQISCELLETIPTQTECYVGVDFLKNHYHRTASVLHKESGQKTYTYTNLRFGEIHSVDISNPLKIVVFYRNFNTVVLLDNRLNELETISFEPTISFVRKSSGHHLWRYNADAQQLENYDTKTHRISSSSPPLPHTRVRDMKSDLNFIFLLSDQGIYTYDYLGNLIDVHHDPSATQLEIESPYRYVLSKEKLFRISNTLEEIELPKEISIKSFFVFKKDLYVFDGIQRHHFLIDKND